MLSNEIIIKRLASIKYLYRNGMKQSKDVDAIAGFSLLSFHDSIEMFLLLLAEHNDVKTDGLSFMNYWDKFPNLTLKESIRALKDRRVNIKHKGLFPSKSDIEISRVTATEFFEQNTINQFGVDFKAVSLFNLINYSEVRTLLEEAQVMLDTGNFDTSLEKASIAFMTLLYSYENKKRLPYQDSIFSINKRSFPIRITREYKEFIDIDDSIKMLSNSIEKLQNVLKITCFGIDFKQYSVFKLLTPKVHRTMNGVYNSLGHQEGYFEIQKNKENSQFCIDFVLDCSLKLQEFDFDINQYLVSTLKDENLL